VMVGALIALSGFSGSTGAAVLTGHVEGAKAGVRIGLRPAVVSPGGVLRYRVENHSDGGVGYGLKFAIQQEIQEGNWRRASFSPKGPWPQVLLGLHAGKVSRWQRIEIPGEAEPGTYRIMKEVRSEDGRKFLFESFTIASIA
jgi:hypothetical protein